MHYNITNVGFYDAMSVNAVDFIMKQTELTTIFCEGGLVKKIVGMKKMVNRGHSKISFYTTKLTQNSLNRQAMRDLPFTPTTKSLRRVKRLTLQNILSEKLSPTTFTSSAIPLAQPVTQRVSSLPTETSSQQQLESTISCQVSQMMLSSPTCHILTPSSKH
jgi:hypothetical protein